MTYFETEDGFVSYEDEKDLEQNQLEKEDPEEDYWENCYGEEEEEYLDPPEFLENQVFKTIVRENKKIEDKECEERKLIKQFAYAYQEKKLSKEKMIIMLVSFLRQYKNI
jgi:hypothetical protein